MKAEIKLTFILFLIYSLSFGQIRKYNYSRELPAIKEQWHKIILPDEIFGKVLPDLSDIRIFGLKTNNDTIEAPYILKIESEKKLQKEVALNLINQSKNNKGYYFTFETSSETAVNQIDLRFNQQNFDWRLTLEGGYNQQEWFTIVDDYRILSIKNELTDFQFTKITFPASKYKYYRLLVDSKKKPELEKASLSHWSVVEGKFNNFKIINTKIIEDKQFKQTIIYADLILPVPISNLKVYVKDKLDYYRRITIEYLSDSVKTPKGQVYNYSTLTSGTLNSIEKNEFIFNSTILRKIKIIIENQDNEPLHIDSLSLKGCIYELQARFVEPAIYYLVYGNKNATKPNYDIDMFTDKIPPVLVPIKPGDEKLTAKETLQKPSSLFQNKNWLWAIMIIIIASLGWFALRMISKK